MNKTIRITVRDAESQGTDPPLARAVLAQVKDIISLFANLEKAIFEDGEQRVVWRIAKVSTKSSVQFEIAPAPSPNRSAHGFSQRITNLVSNAARGIHRMCAKSQKPSGFNHTVTQPLMRVHKRALNGEIESDVDFSASGRLPKFSTCKNTAHGSVEAIATATKPLWGPHRVIGSIEGFTTSVESDAKQRPILWLRDRLKGNLVKCILSEDALKDIGRYRIPRILRGLRVCVHGMMFYRSLEVIDRIEADRIYVYPPDKDIPNFDDIISPNFTGGVEAVEYSRQIRALDTDPSTQ